MREKQKTYTGTNSQPVSLINAFPEKLGSSGKVNVFQTSNLYILFMFYLCDQIKFGQFSWMSLILMRTHCILFSARNCRLKMSLPDGLDCLWSFETASTVSYFKPLWSTSQAPSGRGGTTTPTVSTSRKAFPRGTMGTGMCP